jgi:thiol-disulfide isomerase/thioredoxin
MAPLSNVGFLAVLVSFASVATLTASVNSPELGKAAPPLNLTEILQAPTDASVSWEALRGKVVVIVFWATSCTPCRESIPHWNELVDTFKGKPVQFLAITDENEQIVAAFLERTPIHSWVGLNGVGQSTHDAYHIQGIPTTVIVNQRGVTVAVTHPAQLEPKDIKEVLRTGKSSLPPPVELFAGSSSGADALERVPATKQAFEVSVRCSGPAASGPPAAVLNPMLDGPVQHRPVCATLPGG